jgi:hypothetical protein
MSDIRSRLGSVFKVLGYITLVIFGLLGFIISVGIVYKAAGFWGFVVAFVLLPITFAVAPWYALIIRGDWFPLAISYGGGIIGIILVYIGSVIAGDEEVYSSGADIASDEMQPSLTTRKYVNWYRVALILFSILGIVEYAIVFSNAQPVSIIAISFLIVNIVGLAIKERWGPILSMIYSIFALSIAIHNIVTSTPPASDYIWIGFIAVFLYIFQFVIALKEYKQLGNIGTKGGFNK